MENLLKIELPDYKKIASRVKKRKVFVEEREVETALKWLQKSRAKFIALNRPAQKGDFVEIEFDYTPVFRKKRDFKNGGSFHETSSPSSRHIKDAFVLGQGSLIPGFEEKLEGMSSGQEKEFPLPFPKDKGSGEAKFKVRLKSVQKMELPEISDDWIKSLGQFENLENLKKNIKEGLKREKEFQESQRVRQEILEKIAENTNFEIPEVFVEREIDLLIENLKQNILQHLKISFEDYLKKLKKTEKEIRDSFKEEAKKRIKNLLILKEISKKENIEVSNEKITGRANAILKVFPNVREVQKKLDPERLKEYSKEVIRNEKTLSLLESMARKT